MLCDVHGETGVVECGISLRSELELLLKGVTLEIPDDVKGGKKNIILEVGWLGLCCDLLGAAGAGPWPECFQAQHPCLDCWWHSSCFCAYLPEGCRESRRKNTHSPGCRGQPDVARTHEETEADIMRLQQTKFTSKKERACAFKNAGIARLYSVLQNLPEGNLEQDAHKDIMHLFFNGISRHEGLWVITDLVSAGCVTWDLLNATRKRMSLPRSHRIPHLEAPKSDGKALPQRALVMNAGAVMHFVVNRRAVSHLPPCEHKCSTHPLLHIHAHPHSSHILSCCKRSIALIEPLLNEEARQRPTWICWKAHVRLVCFCLHYTYDATTAGNVLDALVRHTCTCSPFTHGVQTLAHIAYVAYIRCRSAAMIPNLMRLTLAPIASLSTTALNI